MLRKVLKCEEKECYEVELEEKKISCGRKFI